MQSGQMGRPMLPPNPPQGGPGNSMTGQQHTPQGSFQQLSGATPSHPNSPAQNPNAAPSPSLAARQAQNGTRLGPGPNPADLNKLNDEFWLIDAAKLPELKAELGLGAKDIPSMSPDDKVLVLSFSIDLY